MTSYKRQFNRRHPVDHRRADLFVPLLLVWLFATSIAIFLVAGVLHSWLAVLIIPISYLSLSYMLGRL